MNFQIKHVENYHIFIESVDTLVLVKRKDLQHVQDQLNSFHPNLKFTVDDFPDNNVQFLDLLIKRTLVFLIVGGVIFHFLDFFGPILDFLGQINEKINVFGNCGCWLFFS